MSIATITRPKPKVLIVDDEAPILRLLTRELEATYDVRIATSGTLGLEALQREPDIAIVLSDMRMPQMNGTAFLALVRVHAPSAVRVLLTGQCDMRDAIAAVNEGCIFRFLEKPCPPALLRRTLADATAQHRMHVAERGVLRDATARMQSAPDLYAADVLDALAELRPRAETGVEMSVERLREGMILATDLVATNGTLLLSHGQEVTPGTIRRIGNLDAATRHRIVTVVAGADATPVRLSA